MSKFNIEGPKLDRKLLRAIANNTLKLSKTSIHLIIHLTPYIDNDGRIHMDKEQVRKELVCERRTIKKALKELRNTKFNGKKLLTYENGYYVSGFHVSTNGKTTYLKNFPVLRSAEFRNLSLNQIRLFLYILTFGVHNQYTRIAIENLYKNKLHDIKDGMKSHDDYKSVFKDLFKLLDKGFISIRIQEEDGNKLYLQEKNNDDKNRFHEMCNYNDNKKSRTSKYKKHVIHLKVNANKFKEKEFKNKASEAELRMLAERNHVCHEDLQQKTINIFIDKKNKLMEKFEGAGLEIYRSSLEKYFKEKNSDILYFDYIDKAVNYFSDFYLMDEIKKVILGALKSVMGDRGAIVETGYPFKPHNISELIKYFITNSSDEHLVLIDQDMQLMHEAHELVNTESLTSKEPWSDMSKSIEGVYSKHILAIEEMFREECREENAENLPTLFSEVIIKSNIKEFIVFLAKKSLLSKQQDTEEKANKIKEIVHFIKKKHNPYTTRRNEGNHGERISRAEERRSLYFNWLEEA